jgi:hypothetical protein
MYGLIDTEILNKLIYRINQTNYQIQLTALKDELAYQNAKLIANPSHVVTIDLETVQYNFLQTYQLKILPENPVMLYSTPSLTTH